MDCLEQNGLVDWHGLESYAEAITDLGLLHPSLAALRRLIIRWFGTYMAFCMSLVTNLALATHTTRGITA